MNALSRHVSCAMNVKTDSCGQLSNGISRSAKAFTLIELLVVVSIIALLVSILLPALGKARDQAKTIVCLAHQQQIGLGLLQYSHANNGFSPYVYLATAASNQRYWVQVLTNNGYLPLENPKVGKGVWVCPSDKMKNGTNKILGSYSYNLFLDPGYKLRLDAIKHPSAVAAVVDCGGDPVCNPWWSHLFWYNPYPRAEYRHPGPSYGINVLYVDGHCSNRKTIPPCDSDPQFWAKP